ncbi:MAG: FG-GAP-like repeat-containing protein [Beijerinckiaceae bacterium]
MTTTTNSVTGYAVSQSSGTVLGVGSTVVFTVKLATPAVVPQVDDWLTLGDDALVPVARADFSGVDANGNLTFTYTVKAGQNLSDLKVIGTAFGPELTALLTGFVREAFDTGIIIDTTPPAAPTNLADSAISGGIVNALSDTTTQALTGSAEAGSTVTVYDGTHKLGTTTADAKTGAWSYTLGVLANGSHSLTATATDTASPGNTSDASSALTFTVDTSNHITGISSSTPSGTHLGAGTKVVLTMETLVPVTVTGSPELTLSNGEVAVYSGVDASNNPQFTYSVTSGHDTADLRVTGLALNGGTIATPGQMSFAAQQTFATGAGPWSVTAADVNGDGNADLITANYSSATVSVLLGTGDGTLFKTQQTFATGAGPISVTAADVNGDGNADLITANYSSATVSVLLGTGDGTLFKTQQTFATGAYARSVAAADVNGDGNVDLITANVGSNFVSVLLGKGDGTFQTQQAYATVRGPNSVTTADLNGDGSADLITANLGGNAVSVLLGKGDGTFQTQQAYATERGPYSVTAADVNGDGKPDLIVANINSSTVSVLLGKGDGTFQTQKTFATGAYPSSVTAADVNGDGNADLIVGELIGNSVSVLLGTGDGTFQTPQAFATGAGPISVSTADVNGDGKADLITANEASITVSVLLNTSIPTTALDATGIAKVTGADTGIIIDTTAPSVPAGLADASVVNGYVNAANNTKNQTLTGSAEAGATVTVYDGLTKLDTVIADGKTGQWSYKLGVLSDGSHSLTATARDLAGNTSDPSSSLVFTVDTLAPSVKITSGASTNGAVSLLGTSSDTKVIDAISIYDGATFLGSTVSSGGVWSFGTTVNSTSAHVLKVVATDPAGNPGTSSNVLIIGSTKADKLVGSSGDDFIIGNGGGDTITGGLGADILSAGTGSTGNTPAGSGNLGQDFVTELGLVFSGVGLFAALAAVQTGNTARTTFVYNSAADSTPTSHDTITDFIHGLSRIDLTNIAGISASSGVPFWQGKMSNTGTVALVAHSVGYMEVGGNTLILANTSNAPELVSASNVSAANMEIVLVGTGLGITLSDFHHA